MTCFPIKEDQKVLWIEFLELIAKALQDQPEIKTENSIFRAREGDVNIAKLLTATMLATLKDEVITIK
jgi:hypothetical protein